MHKKKIRILFTINNFDTAGMKLVLRDVALGLDPERFEPLVNVLTVTGTELEQQLSSRFPLLNIRLKPAKRPILGYAKGVWAAAQQLKKHKIDIAHSFDYASDFSEGLAMKLAGIPWVAEKTNLTYSKKLWQWRLKLAKRIIVLSSAQARLFPELDYKVTTIPTGTNLQLFRTVPALDRAVFGLKADDVVVASVAQLVPVKGHREIVQAFKNIEDKVPHLKLLFAGKGSPEYAQELQQMIDNLGLTGKIQLLGPRNDIPALLKMCDGNILATRSTMKEGFGAAIIEAFAAGIPVISTRTGGPEDIITPGLNGWLIDAEGVTAIENALLELYNDSAKRKEMGAHALQAAQQKYDVATMLAAYTRVYEAIAKK